MDKKIVLNLDFGIDREKQKDAASNQTIARNYLTYAINLGYKEGLASDKRRIWDKIQDRMETAIEKNEDYFTVNSYEMVFLRAAFEKALVPATETKNFTVVENAVFNAEDIEKK